MSWVLGININNEFFLSPWPHFLLAMCNSHLWSIIALAIWLNSNWSLLLATWQTWVSIYWVSEVILFRMRWHTKFVGPSDSTSQEIETFVNITPRGFQVSRITKSFLNITIQQGVNALQQLWLDILIEIFKFTYLSSSWKMYGYDWPHHSIFFLPATFQ